MSKKKEKKIKFNSIDALVVVVLIVAVLIGVKILNMKPIIQDTEKRVVTAVVEIKEAEKALIDKIQVGDKIFLTVDNVDQATVVAKAEAIPNEVVGLDQESNTYKYTSSPNSKHATLVTIEADVKEDDANIYVGGTSLKVGKPVYIKGKGYSSKGYVVELETKAKGE